MSKDEKEVRIPNTRSGDPTSNLTKYRKNKMNPSPNETLNEVEEGLLEQVHSFVAEHELLERQLGVSDAAGIIALVRGLEDHAREFYDLKASIADQANSLRGQLTMLERFV